MTTRPRNYGISTSEAVRFATVKDRKGRTLSAEDIAHYGKITVSLRETIHLMAAIDQTIEAHGGFPLVGSQNES